MTGIKVRSELSDEPVDIYSEAWRHECECRYVLDGLHSKESRNRWLYGSPDGAQPADGNFPRGCVAKIRGVEAADRIKAGVLDIIQSRKTRAAASS
ncbi:DUF7696 family protein [Geminicoccus harenae]|uniref:DUF7696 family protein n=1 Tax=Geminicoccus harenae TaxID=2498453 RepID=UPI00168A8606|nr:hypothetical protein [Geminicoccus harenae]